MSELKEMYLNAYDVKAVADNKSKKDNKKK
ncbi:Uncharacterised protein [Clostridium paraputrificum]|nr:Uncharacterised protein [Clostridium paraputrificum]